MKTNQSGSHSNKAGYRMQNLLLVTETFFLELSIPKLNNKYLYYAAASSLNIPSHTWKKPALEYDT